MDDAEAGAEVPDFHVRRHAGIMNVIRGCRLIQRSQRELSYRQLHCEASARPFLRVRHRPEEFHFPSAQQYWRGSAEAVGVHGQEDFRGCARCHLRHGYDLGHSEFVLWL